MIHLSRGKASLIPECDEYIRIFKYLNTLVKNIDSDICLYHFFFYEYSRTFIRVKFVCKNIFGNLCLIREKITHQNLILSTLNTYKESESFSPLLLNHIHSKLNSCSAFLSIFTIYSKFLFLRSCSASIIIDIILD